MTPRSIALVALAALAAAPAALAQPSPIVPSPAGPARALAGQWTATMIGGARIAPGAAPKITFNGRDVGGSDGCNQFGGRLKRASGGNIAFGRTIGTLMACAPPIMSAAEAFHRALKAARRYEIAGEILRIADARRDVVMVLERTR